MMNMQRATGLTRFAPRFSLRTVLILTTVVGLYFGYSVREDAQRRRLISDIEAVGGTVKVDDSLPTMFASQRIIEVTVPQSQFSKFGASKLKKFPNLLTLRLTDVRVNTKGMHLEASEMRFTKPSDRVFEIIERW